MSSVTSKSKKLFNPLGHQQLPHLSWGRLLTLAMVAAVMAHLGLPFSAISPAPAALAQTTITVDSTADAIAVDGNCTLREAILAANNNVAVDGCPAGSVGADIIELPGGTITLALAGANNEDANANGDFDISQDVEIIGNSTTIDGGTLARVFHIVGGATTMSDLVITNGTSPSNINIANGRGGGLRVDGSATLNLTDVRVTANSAGAGAGLYVEGTVELNRVTIDNNNSTGGSGGGIRASVNGTINGTNVTISDNQATGVGTPTGGALRLFDNTAVTLTHATIASNQQAGGGFQIRTTQNSNLTLVNSIVAEPNGGGNCQLANAVVGNNNLDDGTSCGFPVGESNLNPQLVALADNGGGTPTRALGLSPAISAAIDRVPAGFCTPTEDQRTASRPFDIPGFDQGGTCDVGAFEFADIPALQVDDVSQDELDSGTSVMNFTVSLTASPVATVTVDYQTNDGTALLSDNDYVAVPPTTLTFAPGIVSQTVPVTITGDTMPEADELFTVDLSNSSWATIADGQGQGTIRNDDVMPDVAIADAPAVAEGNALGDSTATFEVSLNVASTQLVTVTYQTVDGTAQAGIDYAPILNGQLVFNPGETLKTISVQIVGDTFVDTPAAKDFFVDLVVVTGANVVDNRGRAVVNDDDALALPTLSLSPAAADEGNSGTVNLSFEVRLSAASASPVSVDYATSNGSATADSDYTPASGTLVFAPGQTVQTIMITIISDGNNEADETFQVTLSNPVNAVLGTAQATGTITNDDAAAAPDSSKDNDDDDDDDGGSAPPPPPAAPAAPPASASAPPVVDASSLPVTTLPETGFRAESSSQQVPWFLVVGVSLGAVAVVWQGLRRRKNQKA